MPHNQQLRDHPRVCGEKRPPTIWTRPAGGSPPRMRGKALEKPSTQYTRGITPAYAGKRKRAGTAAAMGGDHPRVCGEKIVFVIVFCSLMGSPPRMRGKARSHAQLHNDTGITPAYAGKSRGIDANKRPDWDHPRVCGEKAYDTYHPHMHLGSPPRMRGKVAVLGVIQQQLRITPAYAGKSLLQSTRPCGRRDHPRVCGEKALGLKTDEHKRGSPPRMRGKGTHARAYIY